jgi:hypothetical protein
LTSGSVKELGAEVTEALRARARVRAEGQVPRLEGLALEGRRLVAGEPDLLFGDTAGEGQAEDELRGV